MAALLRNTNPTKGGRAKLACLAFLGCCVSFHGSPRPSSLRRAGATAARAPPRRCRCLATGAAAEPDESALRSYGFEVKASGGRGGRGDLAPDFFETRTPPPPPVRARRARRRTLQMSLSDDARLLAQDAAWARTGLSPAVARVPATLGWPQPTEIQERCIGPILAGRDLVGQAATGSGKTAAYALPLVQRADARLRSAPAVAGGVMCVVVVPTRELCVQISGVFRAVAAAVAAPSLRVGAVYGGTSRSAEAASLANPPHVLVVTPGRLLDHLSAGHLRIDSLECLVLDEADRLLEMGFFDDSVAIIDFVAPRQLVVLSATLPAPVLALVDAEMREPLRVLLATEGQGPQLPETVRLVGLRIAPLLQDDGGSTMAAERAEAVGQQRLRALRALLLDLCAREPEEKATALVFCNTRASAMAVWEALCAENRNSGLFVALLSGEMEQQEREQSLFLLRQRAVHALVATDLGARGLDVAGLEWVINFQMPPPWDAVTFQHRAGRTGRAESAGTCVSLCGSEAEAETLRGWGSQLGMHAIDWEASGAGGGAWPGPEPEAGSVPAQRQAQAQRAAGNGALRAPAPFWAAVRIGAGKRDKLSRGDVLGAVTALSGLTGAQVGLIAIFERSAFVGVPRAHVEHVVAALRAGKIKGERRPVRLVDSGRVALRSESRGR